MRNILHSSFHIGFVTADCFVTAVNDFKKTEKNNSLYFKNEIRLHTIMNYAL